MKCAFGVNKFWTKKRGEISLKPFRRSYDPLSGKTDSRVRLLT